MKEQIQILRKLQELVLTRDEHHQTGDGSHIDELSDAIAELQDRLLPQVTGLYSRLYKKNHIVISAMSNGCCAVCGMQVPIAQSQQVRLAQHLVTCSSCGRILFANEADAAHNVAEKADRDDIKIGIARFCNESLVVCDLKGSTQVEAISELARLMEDNHFIANADSLITAAMDREVVLSTSVEGGLAFPHVRGVEGGGLTLAMGVSRKGVDWNGDLVHVVFLSAIPVAVSVFYLRLMAGLTQSFSKPDAIKSVMEAEDAGSLWKLLVKMTRHYIK